MAKAFLCCVGFRKAHTHLDKLRGIAKGAVLSMLCLRIHWFW